VFMAQRVSAALRSVPASNEVSRIGQVGL